MTVEAEPLPGERAIANTLIPQSNTTFRNQVVRRLLHGVDPFVGFPKKLFAVDCQGWNSNHPYLTEMVAQLRPQLVAEVGVWKGASTITMAKHMQGEGIDGAVIAVDTWLGSSEHWTEKKWFDDLSTAYGYPQLYYKFMINVIENNTQNYIIPLPLDANSASSVLKTLGFQIDLVHIDAAHDYESVLGDLRKWWALLRPGGGFIGDDYYDDNVTWPEVRGAIDHFLSSTPHRDFEYHGGKCRAVKI